MAIKKVWIITGWFANYDELNYTSPYEEFYAETYEEAAHMQKSLLEDSLYENITISDELEEREFYD